MFSKFFNRLTLIATIFAVTLFISCKNEESKNSITETEIDKEIVTETEIKESLPETVSTPSSTTSNSGDVALNPPHGQPGHTCDVPVGQPLPTGSSAKTSPVINTTQRSPVINNTGNVPVNNNTSTGNVNPPHGQPGHKCEIPVGAPLN